MFAAKARSAAFLAAVLAAALFVGSLFLPIATVQQTQGLNTIGGWELLFIGPFGPLNGQFGWYATPCLILTIVSLLRRRLLRGWRPLLLAATMFVLLADALRWHDYPNDGGPGPITGYGLGYAAWIAAVVVGGVGLLIARFGTPVDAKGTV